MTEWTKLAKNDFTPEEYEAAKAALPFKGSYNDIAWAIYERRQLQLYRTGDAAGFAANYLRKFLLLQSENRNEDAMQQIINYLYCALAGLEDMNKGRKRPYMDIDLLSPIIREFFRDHRNCFDEYMLESCLAIPLAKPPSFKRLQLLVLLLLTAKR